MAFSSSDRCLHKGVVARHFTSNPVFPFFPTTRENYPSACLAYIWSITLSPPRIIIYSRLRNHSYDRHPFRRSNRHSSLLSPIIRLSNTTIFFSREESRTNVSLSSLYVDISKYRPFRNADSDEDARACAAIPTWHSINLHFLQKSVTCSVSPWTTRRRIGPARFPWTCGYRSHWPRRGLFLRSVTKGPKCGHSLFLFSLSLSSHSTPSPLSLPFSLSLSLSLVPLRLPLPVPRILSRSSLSSPPVSQASFEYQTDAPRFIEGHEKWLQITAVRRVYFKFIGYPYCVSAVQRHYARYFISLFMPRSERSSYRICSLRFHSRILLSVELSAL